MLDNIEPYNFKFIQKASPLDSDTFTMAFIYKFFSQSSLHSQKLKYIIRIEQFDNAYALKFYAARDRKDDNKYHKTLNIHSYKDTLRLLMTCIAVVPEILAMNDKASFVVNGANSRDLRNNTEEEKSNNQRFRIYRNIVLRKISDNLFEHYYDKESSSFMLINKRSTEDCNEEAKRIIEIFSNIFDLQ